MRDAPDTTWPAPDAFVWQDPVAPPATWTRPGIVMLFNLECPGCIARGVPFLKRLAREHGDRIEMVMIHTAYGHRRWPREQVLPELERFAASFARIPFPIALDLDGSLAETLGAEGTPHWLVYDAGGALLRSVYGSQDNARTRLEYLFDELTGEGNAGAR